MPSVTGLEGIVAAETEISLVDGERGHLVYRGHWAHTIALRHSFEEAANLLLNGALPASDQLEHFSGELRRKREMPRFIREVLDCLPNEVEMMSAVRTGISAAGTLSYGWEPTLDQAIDIIALLPTMIAYRYHQQKGSSFIPPRQELDHVSNYLYMLNGKEPNPTHVKALSAYFILTMEHGMNASTFTARTILSTQSDLISAVTGAIGAMKGPLHGGAPSEVIHMLDGIGTKANAESWVRDKLERGERLMGFGHRVYKTRDPRSVALRMVTEQLADQDAWFDLALHVEDTAIRLLSEYKPGRRLYTNVEFYAAAVLRAVGIPPSLFTPTFTASRIVGWTAHILEQSANNRIFRPQSHYVGTMPE